MPQVELAEHVAIPEGIRAQVQSGVMDDWSAVRVIEWGLDRFAPRIALSASFGSPEGLVILHMMHQIDPARTRVFTVDTGCLYQES